MKLLITGLAVALAGASFAQVFTMDGPLEEKFVNVTGGAVGRDVPTVVYSGIPGPYSAFTARTGSLGFDDYTSTWGGPFTLKAMRFVGGTTVANGTINVSFFDSSSTFVGGFNATLGSAGNFVYNFAALDALNLVLPDSGIVQISATNGFLGQFFLTSSAPTVGTNSTTFGGANGGALRHAFELTAVPEPTSMAALGLGAVAILRRRRAQK